MNSITSKQGTMSIMPSKSVAVNAIPVRSPSTSQHFGIGDAASDQPGAVFVTVSFSDDKGGSYQETTWLETADRDGKGVPTGTWTNAVVPGFTSEQIDTLKLQLTALYDAAVAAMGFA